MQAEKANEMIPELRKNAFKIHYLSMPIRVDRNHVGFKILSIRVSQKRAQDREWGIRIGKNEPKRIEAQILHAPEGA
jgi:hypothetical protein